MDSALAELITEAPPTADLEERPPADPHSQHPHKPWWTRRLWRALIVALVLVASTATFFLIRRHRAQAALNAVRPATASTAVRGAVRIKGTTQAMQTSAIQAPQLAGEVVSSLIITKLIAGGMHVKRGDVLAEFDRQTQLRDSIDKQAQYSEQSASVVNRQAVEDAARAKDETEIKAAEDELSRAGLEMQKVEILSRIDAEKAQEALDEAKATLAQLRQTFDLKRKAALASIRILTIQRDRTHETMLHAQANAALLQVRSPIDGIVVLNSIYKGSGMAEVQEGDQIYPGRGFMQVIDPSTMEVQAPVNQQDFPGLEVGEKVRVHFDAYPDLVCPGELRTVDPMGRSGDYSGTVHQFVVVFSLLCHDSRLMPGLSAGVDVTAPGSGGAR